MVQILKLDVVELILDAVLNLDFFHLVRYLVEVEVIAWLYLQVVHRSQRMHHLLGGVLPLDGSSEEVVIEPDEVHAVLVEDDEVLVLDVEESFDGRLPRLVALVLEFNLVDLLFLLHDDHGVGVVEDRLETSDYFKPVLSLIVTTLVEANVPISNV
jgi:hypothetical protein